ncbi:MAG: carboxymuconolactone decarboxylase family protein [Hyphomicrobiaceae bacterium]|nr:carboxymuconolactone decarboxylase family protein [Hyphomicrobiaceae bacterium]
MPKVGVSPDDRMPALPAERMTEAQRSVAAEFREKRGHDIDGPFLALIRSPEIFKAADHLGRYLRFQSPVPAKLKELAILVTARRWTQQYEWHAHRQVAMHAGLAPETADAIAEGRRPDRLADDEDAIYAFCSELHANGAVCDRTYARVTALFGDQGAIDLCAICGHYSLLAMILNVARTPLPEGATPPLKEFPG